MSISIAKTVIVKEHTYIYHYTNKQNLVLQRLLFIGLPPGQVDIEGFQAGCSGFQAKQTISD